MVGDSVITSMAPMAMQAGNYPPPALHQALDVLADTLGTLPEAARQDAAPLLQALTLAPDSKLLRSNLLAVLMKRA